mgnify:CR=1 FL=1
MCITNLKTHFIFCKSDYFYKVIIGWNGGDDEEQRYTPDLHRFMTNHQPYLEYQTYQLKTHTRKISDGEAKENNELTSLQLHRCPRYLNAGPEISVASTKSFTSMLIVISLIEIWFSQKLNTNYLMNQLWD